MAKNPQQKDSQGLVKIHQAGIRMYYNPPQEQKDTLKYIYKDRFVAMKQSSERFNTEKKWDMWEKMWEGFRDPRTIDSDEMWQSNHVAPVTTSIVQTAISEMVDERVRPLFLPAGVEKKAKATLISHIWDYAWWTANSDLMMYDVFMDMLVLGTAITQEYYRQEKRMVRDVVIGDKLEIEEKEHEIFDYDDVYGEIVKLQDFYVDERARGFDGAYAARDCIRRYIMDIDTFLQTYKGSAWDQFGNTQYVRPGGDLEYYEYYQPPHGIDLTREVEVLHYWAVKPKDRLVIVANDILIYDGPNPYKHKQLPFVRWVDVKRTHMFYGKGEPELLESIQDETNTLRRMVIDRNHLDIDKMFLVSNRIGLSDEDLIARPHGMIPTDDTNAAKPIEYGDIPRSVEVSLDNLENDAITVTGINPKTQSLPESSTATAAAMAKESLLKRIRLKIWLCIKESFPRMSQLRLENILQFYPQPRLEKIVGEFATKEYESEVAQLQSQGLIETIDGEKYMKSYKQIQIKGNEVGRDAKGNLKFTPTKGYTSFDLKPEDFLPLPRGGYIIRYEGGSNIEVSKSLTQSQNMDLYDRLAEVAMQVPNSYDIVKLTDWIIRENYNTDPDEFKNEPPGQDEQLQRMQMLMQLAQIENDQMMQGKDVPPTPYATPAHSRVHVSFMQGTKFQQLPMDEKGKKIVEAFTQHVIGEMMAQENRDQQGVNPPAPASIGTPTQGVPPQQATPQGAPQGGGQPSISNGMINKPGGMRKPGAKISDVLPNIQTGGNRQLS